MKRIALILTVLAAAACSGTQVLKETVFLYPEGQSSASGGPGESNCTEEPESTDAEGRCFHTGDEARLVLSIPKHCNGQMVISCPGGGYTCTCCKSEGALAAEWFSSHGIAECTLVYREPYGHDTVPLTDVQNAMRYCRAHAAEWGVRQIGVIGYSAGGHLAASASTLFTDEETRPDFAILCYPWISLTREQSPATEEARSNLVGDDMDKAAYWSLEDRVTDRTPRTIIFHSADDGIVPVEQSWLYYSALKAHGVPAELHIFPHGYHGWGFSTRENSGGDMLEEYREVFFQNLIQFLDICAEQ